MDISAPLAFLTPKSSTTENGGKLAYKVNKGRGPTFIWCGGLKSDMEGGKAQHLHKWAAQDNQDFIRFDYFGHGVSDGAFIDGTISRWAADVVTVIDQLAGEQVILIGSSMGGWASLLAALDRPARVKALLLIAPAPDFTEKLTWASWDAEKRKALEMQGVVYEPSGYEEPYAYSKALIEDGRARQILDGPIGFDGPVHILQGARDDVVPWTYSQKIVEALTSDDVDYTLVKNGDHSLSNPEDLDRLIRTAKNLRRKVTTK